MGPDELHPKLLKETSDILSDPLAKTFNKTFEGDNIPDKWRKPTSPPYSRIKKIVMTQQTLVQYH